MIRLKVKYFGPIEEGYQQNNGYLEFKKHTFIIGNQGSGKSTVAKLFSTLTWLEKAINREDVDQGKISFNTFMNFLKYHKINNYFRKETFIEYIGEKYKITYSHSTDFPIVEEVSDGNYTVPQVCYIPSERNFLSTISNAFNVTGLPDNIFTFAEELKKAQKKLSGEKINLQIGPYKYEYDEEKDTSYILGNDYKINLLEASSGLQSFTPLFLVSRNLSSSNYKDLLSLNEFMSVTQKIRMNEKIVDIIDKMNLTGQALANEVSIIRSKFTNSCFINIVEEPEQNLYPESQWEMLKTLFEFNNLTANNKLLITTHSPYLINFLPIAVKAHKLIYKTKSENIRKAISEIIPLKSLINSDDLAIYEINDKGSITKLKDYNGIPSDENYLNNDLGKANDLFVKLLEIEDLC